MNIWSYYTFRKFNKNFKKKPRPKRKNFIPVYKKKSLIFNNIQIYNVEKDIPQL